MKQKSSILIEQLLKEKFGESILQESDFEKYPDVETVFADGEEDICKDDEEKPKKKKKRKVSS